MEKNFPQGEELERALKAAYRLYQANIHDTGALIYELTKGARNGMPEKELLEIALEALEKCRYSADEV
ncbi:MAG: hypothetical protein IJ188_01280 [Clostridia bacterium]|nr:hypothetical protein [Clostridia bacterium]